LTPVLSAAPLDQQQPQLPTLDTAARQRQPLTA